jgi:hypothetical protein
VSRGGDGGWLAAPFRLAGALVAMVGRFTVGAAGFLLMGGGLLLIEPLGILYLGIPLFLAGFLLLVKAVF